MAPSLPDPFAPRTSRIIGRMEFIAAIQSAIADPSGESHILFFVGPGGIGKTRLLEEVDTIQENWTGKPFLRAKKIIDLYHADYHSPGGLRDAIADGLDPEPEQKYFPKYRALHKEYNRKRLEGLGGSELEQLRVQFDPVFQKEYAELASKQRLVICFDTLELIQYESETVKQIGQVQDVESAVKTWLLEQVGQFPNTVTLFAARPHPMVQADFTEHFQGSVAHFAPYEIKGFTHEEAQAYLGDLRAKYAEVADVLTPAVEQWIFRLGQIRPIYLTLMLDLLLYHPQSAALFADTSGGEQTTDNEARPSLENQIGMYLVERLQELPQPYNQVIYYLLHARKGLDAELLGELTGWPDADAKAHLEAVRRFAIVKQRPDTEQLFLHDEVYDLWDRYFQQDAPVYGSTYESIAKYYRDRLEQAASLRQHEDLLVALLYYELQVDAYVGYHRCYARWNEEAINSHEFGFDMRLRDEMLRFVERYIDPQSPYSTRRVTGRIERAEIDRDSAVRWVKRYRERGDRGKASQVAEDIRNSKHPTFDWDVVGDPVYKAELLIAWDKVLAYSSGSAINKAALLNKALLPDDSDTDTSASELNRVAFLNEARQYLEANFDWNADQRWWQVLMLGRAFNDLGYIYRTAGRYGQALEAYKRSLPYLNEAEIQSGVLLPYYRPDDVRDEQAKTLTNLAYLLAQLGRVPLALNHIDHALEIRRAISGRYGDEVYKQYPLALSRNTRGLIRILQDHPMWGAGECSAALSICENLKDNRGIGLCSIGVGVALRKRGDQWKIDAYTPEQSEAFFQDAVQHLLRAADIFSPEQFDEPIRVWEAYNELGSLFCDWGWFSHERLKRDDASSYYQASIEYQQRALDVARDHNLKTQVADCYDDLAQVYGDQSFTQARADKKDVAEKSRQDAEAYLDRVLAMVPESFQLEPRRGFRSPPEPGATYWLLLGKVHYRRGTWAFRDIEYGLVSKDGQLKHLEQGVRQFIISAIYFERYWPQSFALEQTLNRFGRFLFVQRAAITSEWARQQVRAVANEYKLDLSVIENAIEDALGM